ncbi:VOC family protein [Planococcus lenghuensis]|nr:VOC family protein [Planococcus lenghuensis]
MLDHIVHLTRKDPEYTVKIWKKEGLHAVVGGRHRQWGTQNALLYTATSYVEWLSLEEQETAKLANHPLTELLLHDEVGFGTICLRTDDIHETDQRLQRAGFTTTGVMPAERQTASGATRRWQLLFIKEEISDELPFPFFIEWEEEDASRYEKLRRDGTILPENEALNIEKCVFGVKEPATAEERWKRLLGGSLQLPNCRMEFRESTNQRERLEEVVFKNGTRKMMFEQGRYLVP